MSSVAGQPGVYSTSVVGGGGGAGSIVEIEEYFGGDYDSAQGDYRTQSITGGGAHEFTFAIPANALSISKIALVGFPLGTNAAAPYDLDSDYGATGESAFTHSESAVGLTIAVTANQIFEIDLTPVLSQVAAGDRCGITLNKQGWGFGSRYLYVVVRYSVAIAGAASPIAQYGSFYLNAITNTNLTFAPVKIGMTTAANLLNGFSHSNARLTYDGTIQRVFEITASLSVELFTNLITYQFYIAKNGTHIFASEQRLQSIGDDRLNVCLPWQLELTTNDYVELFAAVNTGGTHVLQAEKAVLNIHEL